MDRQEYLNQIAETSQPKKVGGKKKGSFFSPKMLMIGAICLVLLVAMVIFGNIMSGSKGSEKDRAYALKLHLDNTTSVISEYQKKVKSSILRSSSASLSSILSSTSRDLTTYITEKYNFKAKDVPKKMTEQATLEKDGLEQDLFEAKINGNLDRIYAHKMAYEISLVAAEEANLMNATKNDKLKEVLQTSYDSLSDLYDDFNDFSEAK